MSGGLRVGSSKKPQIPLFAARQSSAKDVRDACMKDAAHFRALAKRIERRRKTDKSEQSEH
jgi:hypothetical protein